MPRSTFPIPLLTMLEGGTITPVWLIEVTSRIGQVVRLSSSGEMVATAGSPAEIFLGDPGFNMTSVTYSLDGFPATVDITVPIDEQGPIYAEHVKRGVWRKATAILYLGDIDNPDYRQVMATGFVGKSSFSDSIAGTLEFATKGEQLGDIVLDKIQPKCNHVFGSRECGFDLSTRELSGVVATVTTNGKFTVTISNPTNIDFNFGGAIKFTSGANIGDSRRIRKWTSGSHLVELAEGFSLDVEVGDTFVMHGGCARTRPVCVANGRKNNFSGYDHTPGELYGGLK
ncbi:hypothetical protein MPL3356_60474 [Mesorhizobium plurifarium]|uniref:Bacteriophage phiJL001 Gp84 C-terminal domain-containing protein n=1 Tax=Mesorhizobium plurifarium TaxID=69974 RepID=A0A090E9P4_MESPL|nr:hypothetical protein MPL3356_60474 [Mesorhizobium plurifarium]